MKAVFDSDILIDYLIGLEKAKYELSLYSEKCISIISWMEVMIGTENHEEENKCRAFLGHFHLLDLHPEIAERTVNIRKKNRLKLPDAIIWATAQQEKCLLVTRNTKDFRKDDPSIRIPY